MYSSLLRSSRVLLFFVVVSGVAIANIQSTQLAFTKWKTDQIILDSVLVDTTYRINEIKNSYNRLAHWTDSVLQWNYSLAFFDSEFLPEMQIGIRHVKKIDSVGFLGLSFSSDSFFVRQDTTYKKGTYIVQGQSITLDPIDTLDPNTTMHITYLTPQVFILKQFGNPSDTTIDVREYRFVVDPANTSIP